MIKDKELLYQQYPTKKLLTPEGKFSDIEENTYLIQRLDNINKIKPDIVGLIVIEGLSSIIREPMLKIKTEDLKFEHLNDLPKAVRDTTIYFEIVSGPDYDTILIAIKANNTPVSEKLAEQILDRLTEEDIKFLLEIYLK